MDEIEITKQYCLDNCILSGCSPKTINATLHYLKDYNTSNHRKQDDVSKEYGISTVALRNNIHKITRSEHLTEIKKLIGNSNIERG